MGLLRKTHYLFSAFLYLLAQQPSLSTIMRKLVRLWRQVGWRGIKQQLLQFVNTTVVYARWVKRFDTLTMEDKDCIRHHIASFQHMPLISVVLPVYNTPEPWLRSAIESVRKQLYPHWELCIANDASTLPHVHSLLEAYARDDERIRLISREENGHISAASNSALELATGEFIALLDHDDELAEHALYMVATALEENPALDMIYSDEDKIDQRGRRFQPYFKPDWNPDLLLGQNCISHLGIYRTALVLQAGGFRIGFEGCQDWDLALRITEMTDPSRIRHIPHVLYHWRVVRGSTSAGHEAKSYVAKAAHRAVSEHLARCGTAGEVLPAWGAYLRVRRPLPLSAPKVSIIIPTRNGLHLIQRCVESLLAQTVYPDFELLVVDNQSDDPATLAYLNELAQRPNIRVLRYDSPFNFSAITNFAVHQAAGELLCLLNNDTEAISPTWLTEMASHAVRPEVGAVGAMLYYPDDTIQHAGVIVGLGGIAGHWHLGAQRGMTGYFGRAALTQNLSAVTAACMVLRRSVFEEIGGMDEEHLPVAYNDIDLCLRIREKGYCIIWTPYAELYHHESASRGRDDTQEKRARFQRESDWMRAHWSVWMDHDPAYNPNLTLLAAWPYLTHAPRQEKPWRIAEVKP